MENLEKIIKSIQVIAQENKNAQSACNSQRQFQPSRNTGADQTKNLSGQNNGRRQFVQPFNANIQQPRQTVETDTNLQSGRFNSFARGPQRQNLVRAGTENSGRIYSQRPLGLPLDCVGFVNDQAVILVSMKHRLLLHALERQTSAGRVGDKGVGAGTI